MHQLSNVHHKQLNLNITHILRLAYESQLIVSQVFFLNLCKQLSSLSCLLLPTLSQYFIPVTKNVWLPRTPKFDPFPRKTLGQLEHQIHFLAPLFSLFPEDFSCFKLNPLLFQSSHTQISREALAFQRPLVHNILDIILFGSWYMRVCAQFYLLYFLNLKIYTNIYTNTKLQKMFQESKHKKNPA